MLAIWALICLAIIFWRSRLKRDKVAPIFYLYLLTAGPIGFALAAVGIATIATGNFPEYGALVSLLAILASPLSLLCIFLVPWRFCLAPLAYVALWALFCTFGMTVTDEGCPSWLLGLQIASGLTLGLGAIGCAIMARQENRSITKSLTERPAATTDYRRSRSVY